MPLIATAMHYIRRTSTVLRQVLGRAAAQPMRASTAGLVVLSILQLQPSPATAQRQDDGGYQQAVGVSCPQDGVNNRPDGLSYIACNCTSFAAWKLKQAGVPERDFSGLGHAKDWGKAAIDRGSARNGHGKPRAGAIAVSSEGEFGHVLWVVESLEGGRKFRFQDYNGNGRYVYGEGERDSHGFTFLYFSNVGSDDGNQPNKPRSPQGLEIKNIKRTEAKIDWKGQDGVHYWCVNWSSDDRTPNGCDVRVRGRDSSVTAKNLKPDRRQYVWVQACNRSDVCSDAAKTSFKTKK